jgi:ABC-type transport system involved in cytochrome c biogenesis permease subunit
MKRIALFAFLGLILGGIVGTVFGTWLTLAHETFSLWLGSQMTHCDPATASGFSGGCGMTYLANVTFSGTLLGGLAGAVVLGLFERWIPARRKRTDDAADDKQPPTRVL